MATGGRSASTPANRWRWLLIALLLLSFALRVGRIGDQRVWWDEGWSVWASRFDAPEILRETGNDVHPPLYFLMLRLWRSISGDSETGLRLLSAQLGTLTVALTFALGRSIARVRLSAQAAATAGALAALFLAVSRFAVAWSQEIRMYALASLLAVLALWAARRFWDRGRPADALLYMVSVTAGLYTLYLFAPVWAAANVAWLWVLRQAANRRRELLRWAALQLMVLALFLPWVGYAAGGFLSTASATAIRLIDFLHIYWTVLTVGIPLDVAQFNRLTLPAAAIFLVAAGSLILLALRPSTAGYGYAGRVDYVKSARFTTARDLSLLLAVLLLPAVIVYLVSLPKQNFYNPPFSPRYLVIFTSFYSILLAWGLVVLGERLERRLLSKGAGRRASLAGAVLTGGPALYMLAVALVGLRPYYPGRVLIDDYPSLVSTIDAYRRPDDAVILYSDTDWPIFAYHYPQAWRGVPHQWVLSPQSAADYLSPIWETHDAVWLVTTPYSAAGDPQRYIPAWLGDRAAAVRDYSYNDMALTLYARTSERAATADRLAHAAPPEPLAETLTGDARLLGFAQAAWDFKSGDIIHLFLYWTGSQPVAAEVGLMDTRGQVWGAVPVTLPVAPETARQQVDLVVVPDAADGPYRFAVTTAGQPPVTFGRLMIRQRQTTLLSESDVTISRPANVVFDNGIRLLGYDIAAATARPGETVGLTLYWTSDGDLRQQYKVFVHLLGDVYNATSANFLWGQSDSEPAANTRPTTTWRAGEVIVDEHLAPAAPDAPAGTYQIEVGLYDPVTGQRLTALGADGAPAADHILLGTVEIAP